MMTPVIDLKYRFPFGNGWTDGAKIAMAVIVVIIIMIILFVTSYLQTKKQTKRKEIFKSDTIEQERKTRVESISKVYEIIKEAISEFETFDKNKSKESFSEVNKKYNEQIKEVVENTEYKVKENKEELLTITENFTKTKASDWKTKCYVDINILEAKIEANKKEE